MPARNEIGFMPFEVTALLRIEGAVLLAAVVTAFHLLGGNWWLFGALILAPDLAMFGLLAGPKIGGRIYNLAHTTVIPALLGGVAWATGEMWFVPFALIWLAHIGLDRAVGYGLRYPELDQATHLGWIGKARKRSEAIANAG
jgi:hypothetical protein